MKLYRLIIRSLFILLSTQPFLSAQSSIHINKDELLYIGKNLVYLIDTTQSLQIQQLPGQPFTSSTTDILNLGNVVHPVWMRFTVESKTEKEIFMEIAAPLLHELEIYQSEGNFFKKIYAGGSSKPFQERPIKSENWLFNLSLSDTAASTFYLRGKSFFPFQMPITLSSKNRFVEVNQLHNLFWGIYIGVMIFAFLYNFFIFLSVKENIYLYYLLYILSSVLFYLGLEGHGFKFLWPDHPGVNPMIPVFVSLTNCIITFFAFKLLHITRAQKKLFFTGWFFIGIFIILTVLNLAGALVIALNLSQLFSLLICIYFISAGVIRFRQGISTAKYFLIAWSAFLVLVILFILTLNNVTPSTFFNTHGIFLGHMTEVLLLSFALADRINILKAENENKQQKIITQYQENQLLQTKVNRELEEKVSLRTAELVAEKKEVEIQKQRSEDLLLNILPGEVAEELKAKGSAEAKLMDEVSVLFTDFKDFTPISQQLTPKELVAEINECFSAFDIIVQEHGVEKIKTIGDSYMAAGGLPTANKSHAKDVILAALAIQKFMEEHQKKREKENRTYFNTRIGIHSGPVIAGIVGIKKFAYDIWGDTVNIASRMENSSDVGKINISGTTYERVKDQFHCVYRGKQSVKGVGEVDMYFVEGKK